MKGVLKSFAKKIAALPTALHFMLLMVAVNAFMPLSDLFNSQNLGWIFATVLIIHIVNQNRAKKKQSQAQQVKRKHQPINTAQEQEDALHQSTLDSLRQLKKLSEEINNPQPHCAVIVSKDEALTYIIPNVQNKYDRKLSPLETHMMVQRTQEEMEKRGFQTKILQIENQTIEDAYKPVLKYTNSSPFSTPIQFPSNFFNQN